MTGQWILTSRRLTASRRPESSASRRRPSSRTDAAAALSRALCSSSAAACEKAAEIYKPNLCAAASTVRPGRSLLLLAHTRPNVRQRACTRETRMPRGCCQRHRWRHRTATCAASRDRRSESPAASTGHRRSGFSAPPACCSASRHAKSSTPASHANDQEMCCVFCRMGRSMKHAIAISADGCGNIFSAGPAAADAVMLLLIQRPATKTGRAMPEGRRPKA